MPDVRVTACSTYCVGGVAVKAPLVLYTALAIANLVYGGVKGATVKLPVVRVPVMQKCKRSNSQGACSFRYKTLDRSNFVNRGVRGATHLTSI